MNTEILEKMFGGAGRVKIMRLFLFNPDEIYDKNEIAKRAKISPNSVMKEINFIENLGLVTKKIILKDTVIELKDKQSQKKKFKKKIGWVLNENFLYLLALQNLLMNLDNFNYEDFSKKISKSGKIMLITLAGIFIKDPIGRVDILVVGDRIKKNILDSIIKNIEAEIGKELRYAVFETADFKYRLGIQDRLVRDIFDYPHKKILDKLGQSF